MEKEAPYQNIPRGRDGGVSIGAWDASFPVNNADANAERWA
jgi:hypothetical protein